MGYIGVVMLLHEVICCKRYGYLNDNDAVSQLFSCV